ncbi:hypothetical protein [Spirosoma flavum]|uniref:Uncharacterized protein n=1 Tax=Spirosoma flavum TaxID=2048557 RepID=A0ABW6AQT1_9BACT
MHSISPAFNLYLDYLLVNQDRSTATGHAALAEGKTSHDTLTCSLHQQAYGSRQLWLVVKPFV